MRLSTVFILALALECCAAVCGADVMVVVDMDAATPGIQTRVTAPPGASVVSGIGVHVYAPSGGHALWGIGYIGGLDRGIAFGHMPRNQNAGTVTALVLGAGCPINPGNAQELLSPAHQPAFTGPEVQYLEFGAAAPAAIGTSPGCAVFTVDVELDAAAPGDVFDFYLLDMVSVWSGNTHGAFSTTAGLSLDTGGDAVLDGTRSDYGVDADLPIAVPPGAFRVDYVDGGSGGSAKIVVAAPVGVGARGGFESVRLLPIHPDPFHDAATLRFELPRRAAVDLAVFDVSGRRIRALTGAAVMDAGSHTLRWDGRDAEGTRVPPGLYLCRLAAEGAAHVQRVIHLP